MLFSPYTSLYLPDLSRQTTGTGLASALSSALRLQPAGGVPPSWVSQVVGQCTQAANAIRTYVNKTGGTQIPQQLLDAVAKCTMHP
jgi:hypothetical protein